MAAKGFTEYLTEIDAETVFAAADANKDGKISKEGFSFD